MTGVSVVLPVYRNAESLAELHTRLSLALAAEDFELIFVDDACPAGSAAILNRLELQDPRVRVITHARNQGQRLALWHGLQAARGQIAITMDADLQDPPEAIPQLLAALRATGTGAVYAARRGAYQGRSRMATSRAYRAVLQALTGIPGDAGAYLAITRKALDAILPIETPSPYLQALLASTRLPFHGVPVQRAIRPAGQSAYSEWARLRLAMRSLFDAWQVKRRP
ncbi:MAG: glycosyltransferase family 2 protein [Candidatus Solibacter sp.]